MRDFSIDLVWAKIQGAITVIGGWLGYFLGGMDGLMIALVVFVILDYVTGIMCAIADKKLSSAVGFRAVSYTHLNGETGGGICGRLEDQSWGHHDESCGLELWGNARPFK